VTAGPNNPRYWSSQWYSTKYAEEPWPGGWYWHDNDYNWHGPYESEQVAQEALGKHDESEAERDEARKRTRTQFALYHHPLEPHSQKVLIAIYEKGVRFESRIVNLEDDAEREHYRKVYPMGELPLIVLNHGPLIPESSIIIEYMDGFPGRRLISEYPDAARKARFKDRFLDLYVIAPAKTLLAQRGNTKSKGDAEAIEVAEHRVRAVYDFLEHELHGRTWANGEEFSLSDCTAAAALGYAGAVMPYADYPNLKAYAQRLEDRPSVRRVRDEAAAYHKRLSS
jgi:glutathione S-transferase